METNLKFLLKNNYKSFSNTHTCSTKILPDSCRLHRVDRVQQNPVSQRKAHQPNEKMLESCLLRTDVRSKLECCFSNLTRDDKGDVSNLVYVFNTFFSNLCTERFEAIIYFDPSDFLL